jgi:hypothetical protein
MAVVRRLRSMGASLRQIADKLGIGDEPWPSPAGMFQLDCSRPDRKHFFKGRRLAQLYAIRGKRATIVVRDHQSPSSGRMEWKDGAPRPSVRGHDHLACLTGHRIFLPARYGTNFKDEIRTFSCTESHQTCSCYVLF